MYLLNGLQNLLREQPVNRLSRDSEVDHYLASLPFLRYLDATLNVLSHSSLKTRRSKQKNSERLAS